MNEILTGIGADYLVPIILTTKSYSKVSHCVFDIDKITVYPKHITLPNNGNEVKGILGLYSTENPLSLNFPPFRISGK